MFSKLSHNTTVTADIFFTSSKKIYRNSIKQLFTTKIKTPIENSNFDVKLSRVIRATIQIRNATLAWFNRNHSLLDELLPLALRSYVRRALRPIALQNRAAPICDELSAVFVFHGKSFNFFDGDADGTLHHHRIERSKIREIETE